MNPYEVLGVDPSVSDEELSRAYKRLAKKYHPDVNPGNDAAAAKMGDINRAYDQIKTMRQRGESYDYGNADTYRSAAYTYTTYGMGTDPFADMWRNVNYTYRRRSPVGRILAVLVSLLLARLVISILFGGYAIQSYYPTAPGSYPYGYYQQYGTKTAP